MIMQRIKARRICLSRHLWVAIWLAGLAPAVAAPEIQDLADRYSPGLEQCLAGTQDGASHKACIGRLAAECSQNEAGGETTLGMMMCNQAETLVWDRVLNQEYRETMAWAKSLDAGGEADFAVRAERLRDAQRAWITFRDAECGFAYSVWGAGSLRHISGSECLMSRTAQRAIELRMRRDIVE